MRWPWQKQVIDLTPSPEFIARQRKWARLRMWERFNDINFDRISRGMPPISMDELDRRMRRG